MTSMFAPSGGKAVRLARLMRPADGRALLVPIDHSFSDGPIGSVPHVREVVAGLKRAGVDGVVMHKGRIRVFPAATFVGLGLVVHLSGGTAHGVDQGAKVLVGGVEEALAAGADAVSVHINVGARSETRQLADLGTVTGEAARLGVPVLAMMYARGGAFEGDRAVEPSTLAHLAAIAADAGADVVKLPWAGTVEAMHDVVVTSPLPILVAGGPRPDRPERTIEFARDVLSAGAAGLAIGRSVFQAADPAGVARRLVATIHDTKVVDVTTRATVSSIAAGSGVGL